MDRRHEATAGFDPAVLAELDAELTTRRVAGGEVLFDAGDPPDGLALITRGQLMVLDDDGRNDGTFGRGDIVGEIGAVSGLPRTRTVVATRDTELRVMSQAQFEQMFLEHPAVAREISKIVANRLITERTRPSPAHVPSTIAIVRASDGVDHTEFVRALGQLAGPMAVVTARELAGRSEAERMEALDRVERDHELTVLDAGTVGDHEWLDACIRQADTVVVLATAADARRPPGATAGVAQRLGNLRSVTELVVVNPAGTVRPADGGPLRRSLPVDRLHHVRANDAASIARATRLVVGQGTALVLSGGGAKGMAHIGVWRAIQELGVDIDAVSGVSFGALMAWGVALDYTPDELEKAVREHLVEAKGVFDVTLPLVAMLRGAGVAETLRSLNGDDTFDQTWKPFLCTSADLTTGTIVEHSTGPVWRAVRASLSIPGVFPPVRSDGRLLVDGAVRDNLPINSTRAAHPGPLRVIAVDVGDHTTIRPGASPEDGALSGWRHLVRKAIRRPADVPSIGQIMMRVMDLSGSGGGGAADTLIRPDLGEYSVGDVAKMAELEQAGYDAAIQTLS